MKNGIAGKSIRLIGVALLVATAFAAQARDPGEPMMQQDVLISEAFLSSHPDLINRLRGFGELQRGSPHRAANYFRRASRYADKTSQAMYAEMLWTGNGVARDRPAAYAWMDLAAERGYTNLLAAREHYWESLDAAEQARAIEIGRRVYAEYGDDVAKPRMELVLQRALNRTTGSRTGSKGLAGNLKILIPDAGGMWMTLGAEDFYRDEYWKPTEYWTWKDLYIEGPKRGTATAGDLHDTRPTPPKPAPRGKQ